MNFDFSESQVQIRALISSQPQSTIDLKHVNSKRLLSILEQEHSEIAEWLKEIKEVKQLVAFCLLLKVRKDSKWWIYTLRVLFPFIIKLNERESWKVSTNLRSLVCKEVQACHQNAHALKDISNPLAR